MSEEVCEIQVQIKNAEGMHMRPAMMFVDVASGFTSSISVSNGENSVDGKSIMQMTMLAATQGSFLTISAKGSDSGEALEALRHLVEDRMFDEPGIPEASSS